MDLNQYQIYEKDTIDLAKSITIHVEEVSLAINQELKELGYSVDDLDPSSWKYYMNLNGEYHESDPDPFLITSKDTLQIIEFTKENLEEHPVTATSFKLGSDDYLTLVSRNPESEMLIRGIVSPVDYNTSIGSENYTVLDYDKSLVERSENTLIGELQERIFGYFHNHHNKAYCVTDNLYLTANLAILFQQLPSMILNIRLKNCLTSEAHSFHVWAHLASYGRLDRWRGDLDYYQERYLYRNIRWINDDAGETEIFNDLTQVLLSRKGMPLYGYDMRHIIDKLPDTIDPEVLATRYRIDQELNVTNFNATKSIEELMIDLDDSGRDNYKVRSEATVDTIARMQKSKRDRLVTKVLESEKINDQENIELQVRYLALHHWAYMTYREIFLAGIELDFPDADINARLDAKDALALYMYCGSVLLDYRLEVVPDIHCFKVKKINFPSKEDLINLKAFSEITESWINELISRQIRLPVISTVTQFNELCYSLRENDFYDRFNSHVFNSLDGYSNAKLLCNTFWCNVLGKLELTTYDALFRRHSIDPDRITIDNAETLMGTIYTDITGFSIEEIDSNFLLRSLTELLGYLSSYNVTFITEEFYQNLANINRSVLKINFLGVTPIPAVIYLPASNLVVLNEMTSVRLTDFIKLLIVDRISWRQIIRLFFKIKVVVEIKETTKVKHTGKVLLRPITIVKEN